MRKDNFRTLYEYLQTLEHTYRNNVCRPCFFNADRERFICESPANIVTHCADKFYVFAKKSGPGFAPCFSARDNDPLFEVALKYGDINRGVDEKRFFMDYLDISERQYTWLIDCEFTREERKDITPEHFAVALYALGIGIAGPE